MDPISYNTYDTYDLLHYTLLPYGFTIGLSFKDYSTGQILKNVALGKTGDGAPAVRPIDHSLSGDYVRYALRRGALHLEVLCALPGRLRVRLEKPVDCSKAVAALPGVSECRFNERVCTLLCLFDEHAVDVETLIARLAAV